MKLSTGFSKMALWLVWGLGAAHVAWAADDTRQNRGNDPFLAVSSALAACPVPLGPMLTEREWIGEAHYRVERGTSCWAEGKCRLSNAYRYDAEIAEAVQRRLQAIDPSTHWKEKTSLWLMLQRRFIYVQGCVAPDFDKKAFLSELSRTADVEKVVDQTMKGVESAQVPYVLATPPDAATATQGKAPGR